MNINLQKHVPSVSISTARFWKMSMWDECAIVAIPGVCPLLCIYWIAWVPTYRTSAFISGMLYFIPGVLETCQPHILVQTHRRTRTNKYNWLLLEDLQFSEGTCMMIFYWMLSFRKNDVRLLDFCSTRLPNKSFTTSNMDDVRLSVPQPALHPVLRS